MLLPREAAFPRGFSVGKQHVSRQTVVDSAWGSGLRILKIQLMDLKCDLTSIFIVNMILLVKCVTLWYKSCKSLLFKFLLFAFKRVSIILTSSLLLIEIVLESTPVF